MIKTKSELAKDSFVVSVLTFFALFIVLFLLELIGINLNHPWVKPLLFAIALTAGAVHFFRKWNKLKSGDQAKEEVVYKILRYHAEPIANTEYTLFACETTKGQSLIFHAIWHPDELQEVVKLQLKGKRILQFDTFSNGKSPERITLGKKLLERYSEEFYLLSIPLDKL